MRDELTRKGKSGMAIPRKDAITGITFIMGDFLSVLT
jgi:hypothetical protein